MPSETPPEVTTGAGTAELTTVADDEAVVHVGLEVRRYRGLRPATHYDLDGVEVQTLDRPGGELLSVVATVNDVHFGEVECGRVGGTDIGPVLRAGPGEPPYPEMMNAAAITEILALRSGRGPDAVVAKGDLTADGTREQYDAFLARYSSAFGPALHQVRGNHDAMGETFADAPHQAVSLPGVLLAILDSAVPGREDGQLRAEQLEWLDELAAGADRPVLVFTHHHPWNPDSPQRPERYFGINPADSEALVRVVARRRAIRGVFAGHTHRNRVRRFRAAPTVPVVEVASVKDFPGTWAEYRIYEGGIMQVHRRVSSRAALAWSDRTRAMFGGHYAGYSMGSLADRCFVIPA